MFSLKKCAYFIIMSFKNTDTIIAIDFRRIEHQSSPN